jgi:hypothetical protein
VWNRDERKAIYERYLVPPLHIASVSVFLSVGLFYLVKLVWYLADWHLEKSQVHVVYCLCLAMTTFYCGLYVGIRVGKRVERDEARWKQGNT